MLRDLRTPFGGTKASGVGREGGLEAMRRGEDAGPQQTLLALGLAKNLRRAPGNISAENYW